MNFISVIGRLGADSEVKTNAKGVQFVSFRVASNEFNGKENETVWYNVVATGERAIKMQPNLKKGNLIEVRGREAVRLFTNKNNEPQIGRDIFSDSVEWIPVGSGTTSSQDSVAVGTAAPKAAATAPAEVNCGVLKQPATTAAASDSIDDLPF